MTDKLSDVKPSSADRPAPPDVVRFLGAVFAPTDYVLVRPVESWVEGARKRSRVVYNRQRWWRASHLATEGPWQWLLKMLEQELANAFFGVCPRFGPGPKTQFDLSWQIRVVRALWSDVDDGTTAEGLKRCEAAGLPRPSVVVSSGHGGHFYWLLAEPFIIDDSERPPAVYTGFIDQGEGKKQKPIKYIKGKPGELGVPLYLDNGKTPNPECPWGELSVKARHVQDVLGGLAAKIGGDHTTDLARCLRLPGTLNRKDERNGKQPVPCELVECEPTRRYPFADFEGLAIESPARQRREKVAKMQLPTPRKLQVVFESRKKEARFRTLCNACDAADIGQRSDRDWHLVCWAVENGIDRAELWEAVAGIGKFAERGRDYFNLTLARAELHTQEHIFNHTYARSNTKGSRNGKPCANGVPPNGAGFSTNGGGGENGVAEDAEDDPPDEGRPNEADDDPHRLACGYIESLRSSARDQRLLYWRQDWLRWERCAYRTIPDHDLRAEVTRYVRREFERLNRVARWEWQENRKADDEKGPPEIKRVTTALVNDVMQALQSQTLLPADVEPPSWLDGEGPANATELLACRNTLIHLPSLVQGAEGALLELTPRLFSLNALGYDFALDASEPREWLMFLGANFPGDAESVATLQEFFGYCLLPDTSQQKMLLVVGPRRSGKGTIARVLTALVGVGNVCTPTLASLGTQFGLWPLMGKTLAIISDARISGRTDSAVVIERLLSISGEDAQTIDRKHKTPTIMRLPLRLVLMTNELPRLHDDSGALPGRCILLRMQRSWYGKEDVGLGRRLLQEMPGILLWAIAGWQRLHERGRFVQPESARQVIREFEELSSDLRTFLDECCIVEPGLSVPRARLYERWKNWCEHYGVRPTPIGVFGRDLRAALPQLDSTQPKKESGKRERHYVGIDLRATTLDSGEMYGPD